MRPDPKPIVDSSISVSDKIRALDQAGYSRSEIADLLGKRYQHVRNVLVNDQRRKGARPPPEAPPASKEHGQFAETADRFEHAPARTSAAIFRLEVDARGAVHLPGELTKALEVERGGLIIAQMDDSGTVTLMGRTLAWSQAQALVRGLVPPGVSLVDELIAERRAEALKDAQDG